MTLGVALVGSGGIASAHADALTRSGRVQLRRVVSRRAEAAAQFGHTWSFERSGTALAEALSDDLVDVVIITSPSQLHAEQAAAALGADKHVIVEIPVALCVADCERLRALARSVGRRVLVCHTMRSFPAIREMRARVEAGSIDVSQVFGFFAVPRRANEGWQGTRSWVDNLLWHHACHQVDAALWVLGHPRTSGVSACLGRDHPELGMVTDLSMTFRTDSRQVVTQMLTYNTAELMWELRFVTDTGHFTFRDGGLLDPSGRALGTSVSVRDVASQDDAMITALESGRSSDFDLDQMIPAMYVLDLAERSAAGD